VLAASAHKQRESNYSFQESQFQAQTGAPVRIMFAGVVSGAARPFCEQAVSQSGAITGNPLQDRRVSCIWHTCTTLASVRKKAAQS